ncbi:MAG: hypothetical protein FGF52_05305 [Candidatus Brockarchaeota archaeon]|nr:hypothetical protein [Candidatus Brockarchaeota archaeon]
MVGALEEKEYFLRLETYFPKGLKNYWLLLSESMRALSKHVSTSFNMEVYEDFNVSLFHEEELEDFLHSSIHFSKIKSPTVIDDIVDKVLEISEFVEAYISVKGDAMPLQIIGENIYVEGVNVRVLKYGDKGIYTLSYRLFKQNKGLRLARRILSKTSRRGIFKGLKNVLKFGKKHSLTIS